MGSNGKKHNFNPYNKSPRFLSRFQAASNDPNMSIYDEMSVNTSHMPVISAAEQAIQITQLQSIMR